MSGKTALAVLDRDMHSLGFDRIGYTSNVDISHTMQHIIDRASYRELRLVNSVGIDLGEDEKLRDDNPIDLYIIYGIGIHKSQPTSQPP